MKLSITIQANGKLHRFDCRFIWFYSYSQIVKLRDAPPVDSLHRWFLYDRSTLPGTMLPAGNGSGYAYGNYPIFPISTLQGVS